MPKGQKTIIVNVPAEHMFDVVTDYARYPEFSSDVKVVTVEPAAGDVQVATFHVKVVKRISYTVRLVHERPRRVDWTLVKGTLMRSNIGFWEIESLGDARCQVTYMCQITLGALVPRAISAKLVEIAMPSMLQAFKTRAETLFRKGAP